METPLPIRILEAESNKKGDLFTNLMKDLFTALGYHDFKLNRQKVGREIDIEGRHRTEHRRLIAECKAVKSKIGGDDINKFVGVLDKEKRKSEIDISGYFVSLWGFKETALEQEEEIGEDRVILLDGKQIVDELIKGHFIVSQEVAMERAGRCASEQSLSLKPDKRCELLAHELGWIWAIYFIQNKKRTHFTFVHADGDPISSETAKLIIEADKSVKGSLHSLKYLSPSSDVLFSQTQVEEVRKKYFEYLAVECGEIPLEGLPADQDVGSRRLKLENIFVPLKLEKINEPVGTISSPKVIDYDIIEKRERESVGKVLSDHSKLAILAPPGGGKTTLLKRLAIAYAFPERSDLINDSLPNESWLPIFIRCRQLGDLVESSISEILRLVPQRAEMKDLTEPFIYLVKKSLLKGEALLLIDGLDEISSEGTRISFVNQLCTFLSIYPNIKVVVTSREAGFRKVAGMLSEHCDHYKIADFDDDDITRLVLAWHKEVISDRAEVCLDAKKLADTICNSDRVKLLAKNPLLLTTLLLVKRWAGQLPTKRSILYEKTIEVLLWTWNVEGHEPIDLDEAIPQLAFTAFYMMKKGTQRISSKELKKVLKLARKQMPEILSYSKFSIQEFVQRVELRSSLLILSGHEIENGVLCPLYEFQHLTFQEYLTALAVVEGFYPDRNDEDTLLDIIGDYIQREDWKEVITLSAVLAGRSAQPVVRHLIDMSKKKISEYHGYTIEEIFNPCSSTANLLGHCIQDEVQVPPILLDEGLEWVVRRSSESEIIELLYKGKHGERLKNIIQEKYIESKESLNVFGRGLATITLGQINWKGPEESTCDVLESVNTLLDNDDKIRKVTGILAVMSISQQYYYNVKKDNEYEDNVKVYLRSFGNKIVKYIYSDEPYLHFAACWAFCWLVYTQYWLPENFENTLLRLFDIFSNSNNKEIIYISAWAIICCPILERESNILQKPAETSKIIERINLSISKSSIDMPRYRIKMASFIMAYYWKEPWTDNELAKNFSSLVDDVPPYVLEENKIVSQIELYLGKLGKVGTDQLKFFQKKLQKNREKVEGKN